MRLSAYFVLAVLLFSFGVLTSSVFGQDPIGIGGGTVPASPAPLAPAPEKRERFVPTYVAGEFRITPNTFVVGDGITLEGTVVFDQVFSVHWEDLSPERLKLDPFKVLRVTIGPQRPRGQGKEFFADERTVAIHLELRDTAKRGKMNIPAIRLGYSWQDGTRVTKNSAVFGPWNVDRVPMKISNSLSTDVLHLGEQAEFQVTIVREKNVRVLNHSLGVLKDEHASEAEKAEIRRWLKSLEARKESAFNLAAPDLKPMRVVKRKSEEVDRGLSVVSRYHYTIAYYEEAKKSISLPPVKIWYVQESGERGEYHEPMPVALQPFQVFVASRLAGPDSRLEGPMSPEISPAGRMMHYGFGYGFPVAGGLAIVCGVMLFFSGVRRARGPKRVRKNLISFRKARRGFSSFAYEAGGDGYLHYGSLGIRNLRRQTWAIVGAMLGLTHEEVQAKSADELASALIHCYARTSIEPVLALVAFCDRAITSADVEAAEGVPVPKELLWSVAPLFKRKSLWRSLSKSQKRGTTE